MKLELQIRSSLYRLSALLRTMHDELSLLPVSVVGAAQCFLTHSDIRLPETSPSLPGYHHYHAEAA